MYAVGDVHGRLDLLDALLALIDEDDAGRAAARTTLLFLGDLIDRGPRPAGVVRRVRALGRETRFLVRHLIGNHEEVFLRAAAGDWQAARLLLRIGGAATIRDLGITDEEAARGDFDDLARLIGERTPADLLDFLAAGEDAAEIGDYLFVHAGIRPGVPIDRQAPADLRWIRKGFLDSTEEHGRMVVHGHTVTDRVDERRNRIGIDTGAFRSGRLTALGLEGNRRWVLDTAGLVPDEAR